MWLHSYEFLGMHGLVLNKQRGKNSAEFDRQRQMKFPRKRIYKVLIYSQECLRTLQASKERC